MTYTHLTQYAAGFVTLIETPEGVKCRWDNGAEIVLRRGQAAELARVLSDLVEWKSWE